MPSNLQRMHIHFQHINQLLRALGIHPILYGSLGASAYLGDFKTFKDIDVLVEDVWLKDKWIRLVEYLDQHGWRMINEREHEFIKTGCPRLSLASQDILERDGIGKLSECIAHIEYDGLQLQTITAEAFLRAYQLSVKDGYRVQQRGKKDAQIIQLLKQHLNKY